MKKISVIIPCYNVELYVDACLESVVNQTIVEDLEVILVNDGSKDNTLEHLKRFESQYPNLFTVLDQENMGLSMARNNGIKKSTAKYIAFLDSDDTVEPAMYEKLYKKAESEDLDITTCNVNLVYHDHKKEVLSGIEKTLKTKEEIKSVMNYMYTIVCNKLFKRELFKDIKFKKGIWFEDVEILYRLLPHINSIGKVDFIGYNYIQRENSITYTYNKRLYELITNLDGIVDYYKKNNLYNEYKDELEYGYVRYAYATFIKRLSKSKNYNEYKKGLKFAIKKVKENFPDYRKNPYLKGINGKSIYLKYFNTLIAKILYIFEKNKTN